MCISATASFGASAILGITGIAAIKNTRMPSLKLFSGIPLLFAFQQFTEGFVWLTLKNPDFAFLQKVPVFFFLAIALVVWPTIVPLSVLLPEKIHMRRKMIQVFLGVGVFVSLFMLYCLLFTDISASVSWYHVHYTVSYPIAASKYYIFFYFAPTVIPLFISSVKGVKLFGAIVLISFIATHIYFSENVVSVWCFFAALISIVIVSIVVRYNKEGVNDEVMSSERDMEMGNI